jgi:peptidoglycan/LPS O-acetylase OafA/YrhL
MPADLKPLTTVRFWAAAWVVLYDYWPDLTGGRPLGIAKGYLGVELFFVLSGFILSHVYLREWEGKRFRYGAFLWARIARIWPLHVATLIGIGLLGAAATVMGVQMTHSVLAWDALPANLLLVHAWNLAPRVGWNHASWSISAEWFAYLAFPLFALLSAALARRPRLAVAGALALIVGGYWGFERLADFPLTSATTSFGWLRIAPPFAYGCALHLLWRSGVVKTRREAKLGLVTALAAVALLTVLGAPDAATVAAFGVLILSLAGLSSTGSAWLTHRAGVYLGEASFALYMIAVPWRLAFGGLVGRFLHLPDGAHWPLPVWLAMLAGAVPVAMAARNGVERPMRIVLRRLGELRPVRPRKEPRAA